MNVHESMYVRRQGFGGSKATGGMDVSFDRRVIKYRSLRQADRSSRGVPLNEVSVTEFLIIRRPPNSFSASQVISRILMTRIFITACRISRHLSLSRASFI